MITIKSKKKWHFKTKKNVGGPFIIVNLSNTEGLHCQFSSIMTCSFFSFYHSSANNITGRHLYIGASWEQRNWATPHGSLFSSYLHPYFFVLPPHWFASCPFSSSGRNRTVIITVSHPPPLPGHLKDYISQASVVGEAMWLILANGLRVGVSSDTLGWKRLKAVCDSPCCFSLHSESSVGSAMGSSYHVEGGVPRKLPRLRALQEQEINLHKAPEIWVLLTTRA